MPASEWGYGPAPLLKQRTSREAVVFISDIHAPHQDDRALLSLYGLLRSVQPQTVVWLGDLIDAPQISRFSDPKRAREGGSTLADDFALAQKILRRGRDAADNARHIFLVGNHEHRLERYLATSAPELASLPELTLASLLGLKDLEIALYPGAGVRLMPEFLARHGSYISSVSNNASAKREQLAAGISGVSGHTHRLGSYRRGGYVQRTWTEAGCLCQLSPSYIDGVPDWQQGIAIAQLDHKRGVHVVSEVPVVLGRR